MPKVIKPDEPGYSEALREFDPMLWERDEARAVAIQLLEERAEFWDSGWRREWYERFPWLNPYPDSTEEPQRPGSSD